MPNFANEVKINFKAVSDSLLNQLATGEELNVNLHAEDSLFIRFNNNQVRQNTSVQQQTMTLLLQAHKRSVTVSFSISGDTALDTQNAAKYLAHARQECALLPEDPNQTPMMNNGTSDTTYTGQLLPMEEVVATITAAAQGSDMAGLYSAGAIISANRNSKGQSHWFATETFVMDYSLYNGSKAVKGIYAGSEWKTADLNASLAHSKNQMALMNREKKVLSPGAYRAYLAPGAVAEISSMFGWGSFTFAGYKQGMSAMQKLADKEKSMSPLFSIRENYSLGLTTPFNSLGELAPEKLDLISQGEMKNFLVSTRSAKEYGVPGNFASPHESPRSLEILPGSLKEKDILKELGTGVYLSNLHYINWSDRPTARITGMTRYACFWVENGEIIAPIADMRFDESLYDCLGENLLAVTEFQHIDPATDTYEVRALGGKKLPGMLIKDFKFTL